MFDAFAGLLDWVSPGTLDARVTVDVPIGLPDQVAFRSCDNEARSRLGSRRSSVFAPPARYLLGAADYSEIQARVAAWRLDTGVEKGGGLSQQAFGILPKVQEVDDLMLADPEREQWVGEVHPEVSFLRLFGQPLAPKASPVGLAQRIAACRAPFPDLERSVANSQFETAAVALDDVLDAYAALWTALRWRDGEAESLGGEETDSRGLLMRMLI